MGKKKIFNDPLYGLIHFPFDIIYQIIDHPYFQRLRRINQMGLASFVYPGAQHTRFQHSLGALHLCNRAIHTLKDKGVPISIEEHRAVNIAVLLHDIGHGPFSHALEGIIMNHSHEELSLQFFQYFEKYFQEDFTLARAIFNNSYERAFFHELIASQLDVDRMDYLNRDSFFTGVIEGKIGYDRILAMLNVDQNQLVVEKKGLYSVEKFLIARNFMYWQVYLHKTAVCVEQMLKLLISLFINKKQSNLTNDKQSPLNQLLKNKDKNTSIESDPLSLFTQLDDYDIWNLIKTLSSDNDPVIRYVAESIINRNLFKVIAQKEVFKCDLISKIRQKVGMHLNVSADIAQSLILEQHSTQTIYDTSKKEILILDKSLETIPFSEISQFNLFGGILSVNFLCYPRL